MSIVFMDGFDYLGTSFFTYKWDPNMTMGGSTTGRYGGLAGQVNLNSGTPTSKTFSAAASTLICGFDFKTSAFSTGGGWFVFTSARTGQIELRFTTAVDGTTLSIWRTGDAAELAHGTAQITANVWYHIEIKATFANSALLGGRVQVYVEGISDIDYTGDTQNTASASADGIYFRSPSASYGYYYLYFDNLVVLDTAGSTFNDFIGPSVIDTNIVNASDPPGTYSEFTPLSSTNAEMVNDATPDGDTTYNYGVTAGKKDTYNFSSFATGYATHAVQANIVARRDKSSAKHIAAICRSGGTDYQGSTKTLSSAYLNYAEIFENDPATPGVAWTDTALNAAEFGLIIVD